MFGFDCGYYGADVDELSRQMSILPVDMAKTGVLGRVILVILLPSPREYVPK